MDDACTWRFMEHRERLFGLGEAEKSSKDSRRTTTGNKNVINLNSFSIFVGTCRDGEGKVF
jgi:hypothetical protein